MKAPKKLRLEKPSSQTFLLFFFKTWIESLERSTLIGIYPERVIVYHSLLASFSCVG
jgi:hypothetical protein